jgi:AcrR family transcriptional regulator
MSQIVKVTPGLREQNKQRRRARIASTAARLVHDRGFDDVTVEDISNAARVGRATFFRYFDSKETAVVVGFYEDRLAALVGAIDAQPRELDPRQAAAGALRALLAGFTEQRDFDLLQGQIIAATPSVRARALEFQATYEAAIASSLAPRFRPKRQGDLRARFLAAQTLAIIRVAVERWVEEGGAGDLPAMMRAGIAMLDDGAEGNPRKSRS